MSEMVERVANAMNARRGEMLAMVEDPERFRHSLASGNGDAWKWLARAAVEAMREPSEAMLRGAFVAMNETPGGTWKTMKAEGATPRRLFDVKMAPRWRAMIDAALR